MSPQRVVTPGDDESKRPITRQVEFRLESADRTVLARVTLDSRAVSVTPSRYFNCMSAIAC